MFSIEAEQACPRVEQHPRRPGLMTQDRRCGKRAVITPKPRPPLGAAEKLIFWRFLPESDDAASCCDGLRGAENIWSEEQRVCRVVRMHNDTDPLHPCQILAIRSPPPSGPIQHGVSAPAETLSRC